MPTPLRPLILGSLLLLAPLCKAQLGQPVSTGASISSFVGPIGVPSIKLGILDLFDLQNVSGEIVKFDTRYGDIYVEMLSGAAPLSVQNFLNYVGRGDFDNSVFHRSPPGFVVQGGAFRLPFNNGFDTIPTDPAVANEFKLSNTRGTLSLAKQDGDPNSATASFFFNVGNNSANLDNQNGGFTVFARTMGAGMRIIDRINALPRDSNDFPYDGWDRVSPFLGEYTAYINTVRRNWPRISTNPGAAFLTLTASSSAPAICTASTSGGQLMLKPLSLGAATITVTASDPDGNTANSSFVLYARPPSPFEPDGPLYDFNGDRTPDLLWRNPATGVMWIQKIRNGNSGGGNTLLSAVGHPWELDIADFNGDHHPDFLWRNPKTGLTWVQYMLDGFALGGRVVPGAIAAPWELDIADFNRDGHPDFLWRNPNSGNIWIQYLRDGSPIGGKALPLSVSHPWDLHLADFDLDGNPDFLWRNPDTSSTKLQFLSNGEVLREQPLGIAVGHPWKALVDDHNDDGHPDILWRNPSTGTHWFQYLRSGVPIGGRNSTVIVSLPWELVGEE